MMMLGEALFATNATITYSPWFESCGDGAVFACEIMAIQREGDPPTGNVTAHLEIEVETKSTADDDASTITLTRQDSGEAWGDLFVGVITARYSGFKDLVRFKYLMILDVQAISLSAHFRMLPPMWQANCLNCSVEKELRTEVDML